MLLASLIIGLAQATVLRADPCVISFENTLLTSCGQNPVLSQNVTYTTGKTGLGGVFNTGCRLDYPTSGLYDSKCGTVELWVRPNWDSATARADKVFWGVPAAGGQAAIGLGFYGNDSTQYAYFCTSGIDAITVPVSWTAGQWHKLVACWDERASPYCRGLYIDGVLKSVAKYSSANPSAGQVFHVGCWPGYTYEAQATIDELSISQTVELADFLEAAEALRTEVDPTQEFLDAYNRLKTQYTLDSVASDHIEVGWDDVAGAGAPFTKRVPIQVMRHPQFIFAQPDMSIALGNAPTALGLGFAFGDQLALPDILKVTRRLHKGYQPIVESEWEYGPIKAAQTVLTTLPSDAKITTGTETQYVIVRMTLTNSSESQRSTSLTLCVGRMADSQNTNYAPFVQPLSCWQTGVTGVTMSGNSLLKDGRVLLTWRPVGCEQTPAQFYSSLGGLKNCLKFAISLGPLETRTIDFVVAGNPALYTVQQAAGMKQIDFNATLKTAEAYLDSALEPGMKLTTPEQRLNDIYKTLILSSLGNLPKSTSYYWDIPYQSPIYLDDEVSWDAVWPWEYAHMAAPMISLGFHEEMKPTLRFFTQRQNGIGPLSANRGPIGDVSTIVGSFPGCIQWMNETGSVLWAMAEVYRYSRDAAWLNANSASILAAWDWIQGQRARTKVYTSPGVKASYYGLLPAGRISDAGGNVHCITFTDGYTWMGMNEIAAAFRGAGLPQAAQMTSDVNDYRSCILDSVQRVQYVDPGTNLLYIPDSTEGTNIYWQGQGPMHLFGVGLLDPSDSRFEPMVEYVKRTWGMFMGLHNFFGGYEYYINQVERSYYLAYLGRGEYEKALLTFYSNLVYSMSGDCYQTAERMYVTTPNLAPFQPNLSGNGRILDMMRRMVIDEQDADNGVLWLLRGCPRRWFAQGKSIVVQNAPTLFGKMALATTSTRNTITIDIDCPDRQPVSQLKLLVRHPDNRTMLGVTVNGSTVSHSGETITIAGAQGHLRVVCSYE